MTTLRINTGQLSEIHQMNKVFSEQLQDLAKSHKAHEATLVLEFQNRVTEIEQGWQNEKTLLEQAVAEMQAKYEHVLSISEEQTVREDRLRGDYAAQLEALRSDQAEREIAFKHAHQVREAELQQDFERKLFGLQSAWLGERAQLERTIESLGATEERLRADYSAQLKALRGDQAEREVAFKHAHQEREAELKQDFERQLLRLQTAWVGERTQLQRMIESLGATEERLRAEHSAQLEALGRDQAAREIELKESSLARETELKQDFERHLSALQTAWMGEKRLLEELVEALRTQRANIEANRLRLENEVALGKEQLGLVTAEMAALRKSWSWRLTWPLRWLGGKDTFEVSKPHSVGSSNDSPSGQEVVMSSSAVSSVTDSNEIAQDVTKACQFQATHVVDQRKQQEIIMTLDELLSLQGDAFVNAAYRILVGREADEAGLRHYLKRLANGYRKSSVIFDIAESSEAKARKLHKDLESLPDDIFIEAIYRRLLGRLPDSVGKNHYFETLKKNGKRNQIVRDIERSAESRLYNAKRLAFMKELHVLLSNERAARGVMSWLGRGARIEWQMNQIANHLDNLDRNMTRRFSCCEADISAVKIKLGEIIETLENSNVGVVPVAKTINDVNVSPLNKMEIIEGGIDIDLEALERVRNLISAGSHSA